MFIDLINEFSKKLQIKKCIICDDIIVGTYYYDSWSQFVHKNCNIGNCFCCGRILSHQDQKLSDGRHICAFCKSSIVIGQLDINWVDERVRLCLNSVGILNLPTVSIEIVSKQKIHQLLKIKTNFTGDSYGVTKYTYTVSAKSFKIYILDYLPKTFFAGVLAHEYLHVWQFQKDLNPPRDVCEGFCNLGAMVMYQKINSKLSNILIEQMEMNPDPIYGDGFRKVKKYLEKESWQSIMNKLNTYK